jgi:hypothetical protein
MSERGKNAQPLQLFTPFKTRSIIQTEFVMALSAWGMVCYNHQQDLDIQTDIYQE